MDRPEALMHLQRGDASAIIQDMIIPSVMVAAVLAWGQASGAPPGNREATSRPAAPALGDAYIDGSEEFSIRPPVGWQLNRQRLPDPRGITVLRMMGPMLMGPTEEISVRRVELSKRLSPEQMLKNLADSLGLEFSDVRVSSQQLQQVAGKPGGFVSAGYAHEGMAWRRMLAFAEVQPRSYLILTYNGPLTTDAQKETLFQLVASSLAVLPRSINDEELRAALAAGQAWKNSLTEQDLTQALGPSQFLRLEQGGKTTGFVTIDRAEFVLDRKPGVRIIERGWTFDPSGRARTLDYSEFLANDFQTERWRSSSFTLLPAQGSRPSSIECSTEEGLRLQDRLSSDQSYACGMPATQNTALKLPPSYLSRVLVRSLPRLAKDLDKPRRLAFTSFDHLRADLVIRFVEFKGESALPTGVAKGKIYRVDDREGLASEPTSLYVDENGETMLIQSGNLTMRPAAKDELERELGARVADADRQLSEIEKSYTQDQERFDRPVIVQPPPAKQKP